MNCPLCGKKLTSVKSIIRGRGYKCNCKRKESDKNQIVLNFNEVHNDRARESGSERNEGADIPR